MSVLLSVISAGDTLFEISEKISKHVKSLQADVFVKYIGCHDKLNDIEVVNHGNGVAKDVQIIICGIDDNECYWDNTQNSQTYTIYQLQANESQKLSIAYWGFQNKDVKVQIKWTDKRGKEHHKDMTLQLLGLCD